jgi:L-lactate dehydrogenase complex protein LldE
VKVALFVTCLVDGMVPSVGQATVALLERLGVTVEVPLAQTCCGQLHTNTGYGAKARPLVRSYAETFSPYEYVVTPSASCAGSIRHQHPALVPGLRVPKTYELSEFLVDVLGVEDVGATYRHRVTYHPTCHSLRLLGVGDRPLRLLRHVRDLELVELPDSDSCCGFGGTFAVKNPDVSGAMLADKVERIHQTGADICSAGDASCLMHIGGGLSRLRSGVRTVHLAEILASTA